MKLFCATSNPGKVEEFRHALAHFYEVEQLPDIANIAPPEETGRTFKENAILKARYYSQFAAEPVFADDSGLEVDALHAEPGVRSARYAGDHANSADNNRLLLERLHGIVNRSARFVCVIALAQQGRILGTFQGSVEGRILEAPRGTNGFGYDPLFFHAPFGCTFGEASIERKTDVSHRARALRAMLSYLQPASGSSR